jgi:hypothetical protein
VPLFFYIAKNEYGQKIRGTIDSISTQAARAALKQLHLEAVELHEATMAERKEFGESVEEIKEMKSYEKEVAVAKQETIPEKKAKKTKKKLSKKKSTNKKYFPLIETIRLYAGWLLAWYILVYALGGYQNSRDLPFSIPYVEALLPPYSSIVFSFTIASFLFLLLTTLIKEIGAGKKKSLGILGLGLLLFTLYRINV